MERYVFGNRIFKDAFIFEFRVGRKSIGDHVSCHISSIALEVYLLWGPTRCESDGDRDA